MILVVDAGHRGQFAAELAAMQCHRLGMLTDRTDWKVPAAAEPATDRYDLLQDTVYLLAKDEPQAPVLASIRCLPTTGPHLIRDLAVVAEVTPEGLRRVRDRHGIPAQVLRFPTAIASHHRGPPESASIRVV